MPTQRKAQASRRNAQLSTGPKTPGGKAIVSRNAVKHGLASRIVVLPEENREDFLTLLEAFHAEFQPASPFEESLVFQLAAADWRLRRVARIEVGLFGDRLDDLRDDLELEAPEPEPDGLPGEEQFREDTRLLGRAFRRNCSSETFVKLLRYRCRIGRTASAPHRRAAGAARTGAPSTKPCRS